MAQTCKTCNTFKDDSEYGRDGKQPNGLARECRICYNGKRAASKASRPLVWPASPELLGAAAAIHAKRLTKAQTSTTKIDVQTGTGTYVADRELLAVWSAMRAIVASGGLPANLMFVGPSGSGKTEGAQHLAAIASLPFVKVDAAAMTDPEAWFGTREVVVEGGASKTIYRPSAFVEAISRPGVLLIDEANRCRDEHRNILVPLLDSTREVSNPITGETVKRHPECYVIMTANIGLQFTGTFAVDAALITRSLTHQFAYLNMVDEARIVEQRTKCSPETALLFVRFAAETRQRAAKDEDFVPISTREVLMACYLVAAGLSPDLAAKEVVLNAAPSDGGGSSVRAALELIWGGIRVAPQMVEGTATTE